MRHDEKHDADACAFCRERLPDYAAGHLQGDGHVFVERHLRTCARCSVELREWEAIKQTVRSMNGVPQPQRAFADTWSELRAQLSPADRIIDRSPNGRVLMEKTTSAGTDESATRPDTSELPRTRLDEPTPKRWRASKRFRGVAAAVAMVGTVAALIAVLITLAPGHRLGSPFGGSTTSTATNTNRGHWVELTDLDYNAKEGANSIPVIAPTNPLVVYETQAGGSKPFESPRARSTMRRTDDGGKTWHVLPLPVAADYASYLGVAVSPLNARTVFLDFVVETYNASDCPAEGRQYHADMNLYTCSLQYTSVDAGQHWKATVLPSPGTLTAESDSDGVPAIYKASLHALGNKLYAGFACAGLGLTCTRLVTSADGGLTWRFAEEAIVPAGGSICDYATSADGTTLFAATSAKSCWLTEQSPLTLWHSSDAGAHWTQAGTLPTPNVRSMLITKDAASGKQLLYAVLPRTTNMQTVKGSDKYPKQPVFSVDIADLKVSADGGKTWESAPNAGIPADRKAVDQYGTMHMLGTLSDGSVVMEFIPRYFQDNQAGGTLFAWKRGDAAWRQIAPPFTRQVGSMLAIPAKNASQQDTLYLVVVNRAASLTEHNFDFLRYES